MSSVRFVLVGSVVAALCSAATANIDLNARYVEHTMNWLYGYQGDARTQSDHELVDTLMTDIGNSFAHGSGIVDAVADGGNYFGHDWSVNGTYGSSTYMQNYPNYSNIAAYPHDLTAMTLWGSTHSTTTQTGNALTSLTTTGLSRFSFSVTGNLGGPSPIKVEGVLRETGAEADAILRLEWFGPFGWQALAIWGSSSAGPVNLDQTFMLDAGQLYRVEASTYARDLGLQPARAEWELILQDLAVAPEPASLSLIACVGCIARRARR